MIVIPPTARRADDCHSEGASARNLRVRKHLDAPERIYSQGLRGPEGLAQAQAIDSFGRRQVSMRERAPGGGALRMTELRERLGLSHPLLTISRASRMAGRAGGRV